jgi:hypothetical protein
MTSFVLYKFGQPDSPDQIGRGFSHTRQVGHFIFWQKHRGYVVFYPKVPSLRDFLCDSRLGWQPSFSKTFYTNLPNRLDLLPNVWFT